MADARRRAKLGPYHVRIASGKLFLPGEVASRLENMVPTEEGTLRSVVGPAPYVPKKTAPYGAPASADIPASGASIVYGNAMRGIHHCLLRGGEKEVLLLHTADEIWSFQGWAHYTGVAWKKIVGPTPTGTPLRIMPLPKDTRPRFPTQFVTTPSGVVIIPQDARALFYDGLTIYTLGYDQTPGPPTPRGPSSQWYEHIATSVQYGNITGNNFQNNEGYAHDALWGFNASGHETFKYGRVGTTLQSGASNDWSDVSGAIQQTDLGSAWLEPGVWRCAVQFVDRWGNLSPLSGESAEVRFARQASFGLLTAGPPAEVVPIEAERVRKHIAWTDVPVGPPGTVGRILYRSKDRVNSGTLDLFMLPLNSTVSTDAFTTLPDNVTTTYPDNIPDFWLTQTPVRPVPVTNFRLGALAMGRFWAANFDTAPGLVRPSMAGRWGTFLEDEEIYPDPSGGELTGLVTVSNGLLVFTRTSTYRIEPYYDGPGFRTLSLSHSVGCVAPSSAATLADGRSIWMARDGFYSYDGTTIKHISEELDSDWRRHNTARNPQAVATVSDQKRLYRCWVARDGSPDNTWCYEYDGMGWRAQPKLVDSAAAVCTTQDHRSYTLVAGKHGVVPASGEAISGVWLLDHEVFSYAPDAVSVSPREALIETSWLGANTSQVRSTAFQVMLWFVERGSSDITVEVKRDWRNTVVETHAVPKNPTDDPPAFWGTATWGDSASLWTKNRPYWRKVQIYIPSAEVFRLVIRGTGRWEFAGFQLEATPHPTGGSRTPP